jgi:son of sevenless
MQRQVLGLQETVLGKEHPDTLTSMNNVVSVLSDQGKYDQAEDMRKALGLCKTVRGLEHSSTLRAEPGHATNQRPQLIDVERSRSYTFSSQIPPSHAALQHLNVEPIIITDENPWYLQLDHLGEVSYNTETDPPQPESGTLVGLVEQLTRHDRLDPHFNSIFLLTYRSFTSASELFDLLVRRFAIQPPPGLTRHEYLMWEHRKQKLVRVRVVNILKSWLGHYWMENNDNASQLLLERAFDFAKNTITKTSIPGSRPLMTVILQRMMGQDICTNRLVLTLNTSAPVPKKIKKLKFLLIDATEFARQLTIVESKLYHEIKLVECLDMNWQKKPRDDNVEPAPNVKNLILHSNQLINWVAETILSQVEFRKRVAVIKHFVTIANVSTAKTERCVQVAY